MANGPVRLVCRARRPQPLCVPAQHCPAAGSAPRAATAAPRAPAPTGCAGGARRSAAGATRRHDTRVHTSATAATHARAATPMQAATPCGAAHARTAAWLSRTACLSACPARCENTPLALHCRVLRYIEVFGATTSRGALTRAPALGRAPAWAAASCGSVRARRLCAHGRCSTSDGTSGATAGLAAAGFDARSTPHRPAANPPLTVAIADNAVRHSEGINGNWLIDVFNG